MAASVPAIVEQHVESLAVLWSTRRRLATTGQLWLNQLARFDVRIAAHEDGCVIAGDAGIARLVAELEDASAARLFALSVVAVQAKRRLIVDRCLMIAEALPETRPGVVSALGWLEAAQLAGLGRELLGSTDGFRRSVGLAACRVHAVDPGPVLVSALVDPDNRVRGQALRTVGVLGKTELVSACVDALSTEDSVVRFSAARAAVLLGDRRRGVDALKRMTDVLSVSSSRDFGLALQAMSTTAAHETLQSFAGRSELLPRMIQGSGIAGDPGYVAWLAGHMFEEKTARLAGEAFSLITGADLALMDLERNPAEDFESGPNDDPNDANVGMDDDDGLPWPDPAKIQVWWAANQARFAKGTRYFMGAPVTREHCIDVLKNGYQRQRILAAQYLCLLEPGTPLFNTSAPAWRQQRWLAKCDRWPPSTSWRCWPWCS
jgi:uncharacterized protein (TIGR02270 family)